MAVLGLCCCIGAFSSYSHQGLLSSYGVLASQCSDFSCVEHGFYVELGSLRAGFSSCSKWA